MLNFTFFSWARLTNLMSMRSASSSLLDAMIMSSAITCTLSMSQNVWYTLFCRTSDAEQSPKGIRLKTYLPNGVLKVVIEALSSDRGTCQNSSFRSITVNTFLPLRRQVTSSTEGI